MPGNPPPARRFDAIHPIPSVMTSTWLVCCKFFGINRFYEFWGNLESIPSRNKKMTLTYHGIWQPSMASGDRGGGVRWVGRGEGSRGGFLTNILVENFTEKITENEKKTISPKTCGGHSYASWAPLGMPRTLLNLFKRLQSHSQTRQRERSPTGDNGSGVRGCARR